MKHLKLSIEEIIILKKRQLIQTPFKNQDPSHSDGGDILKLTCPSNIGLNLIEIFVVKVPHPIYRPE